MKTRIIEPTEKTHDKDGRTIRPGDMLTHPLFGLAQIDSVDIKSCSIHRIIVRLIKDGEYTVKVVRPAIEFTKLWGKFKLIKCSTIRHNQQ